MALTSLAQKVCIRITLDIHHYYVNIGFLQSLKGFAHEITRIEACGLNITDQAIHSLTDNNFDTCESINDTGDYIQSFGLFMDPNGVQLRSVGVIVVGIGFSCVPSDGVTIQIVYSDGQIMDCQVSSRGKVCHYSCYCDHRCALALVKIKKYNSLENIYLCEITTGKLYVNWLIAT